MRTTHDWLQTDADDVERPPQRLPRDWALFALIAGAALAEVGFRTDMTWRWAGLVVGLVLATATLWRRTHPVAAVALGFGISMAVDLAVAVVGADSLSLNVGLAVLILIYALFRWGTGRQAAIGSAIALTGGAMSVISPSTSAADVMVGLPVLLFPAALGASVRYRRIVRNQQFERVRFEERDTLARELHDTVAHHVSAIAIQAQAGKVLVTAGDLAGTVESLSLIEKQATLSLTEMRSVVAALRREGEASDMPATRGMKDIEELATAQGTAGPRVEVDVRGDLDPLRPGVPAAMFRVAQESVTNAKRHAPHATCVRVVVVGQAKAVHLSVTDDGDRVAPGSRGHGYGLVGMEERVTLLGGTFQAGPLPERGWTVQAVIPRSGRPE
ncbi:sensor histidine kinase [Nocardioides sp.]|uniref:sensor histidine kinase n=1 Tax=Nocardioides sp. TaxID=35761 RepID=UPI002BD6D84C|nr:histidine kinase [Nocardioides sp.]HXH78733.1 histidine kinase [Nocardioides sp.]